MRRFLISLLLLGLYAAPASGAEMKWLPHETEHFIVYFTNNEGDQAAAFGRGAETLYRQSARTLGDVFDGKITVYLAPDRETYNALQPHRSAPEWSVGAAIPRRNTIIMFSAGGAFREGIRGGAAQTFVHELTHLALHQLAGKRRVPRWLDEGLAQMLAGQWSSGDAYRLTVAVLFDRLIPLEELVRGWPREASRARLAYAQSLSLAIYLEREGYLPPLLQAIQEGYRNEQALERAIGLTSLPELEKNWRRYLRRHHTWLVFLNHGCVWSLIGLLALVAFFVLRRKRREQYERLDDDPGPPDPRLAPPYRLRRRKFRVIDNENDEETWYH